MFVVIEYEISSTITTSYSVCSERADVGVVVLVVVVRLGVRVDVVGVVQIIFV